MKIRGALLAATMMALPVAANAQAINGLYVGAGVGANAMHQMNMSAAGGVPLTGVSVRNRVGPSAVLSVGYGFGNGLRAEIEGSYRYNALSGFKGVAAPNSISGREQKFGVMVNGVYDFVGIIPGIVPYLGAGVGYQSVMLDSAATTPGGVFTIPTRTKGSFAYQGIVGAALPIDAAPGLSLTAEYRFMGLTGTRTYPATGVGAPTISFNSNYNHSVLLGVRYAFGQAPTMAPAPAAPPAAQASRSYLVFFDWDKATLTDRARGIVKEAADNSRRVQVTRIEVNGYTDTSGTKQYNQGLSVRRAQAVAAELVKNGVAQGAISIQGFGDTKQLVPTGANTREPQNRRVEIIIR